jgi:hypothetical protein
MLATDEVLAELETLEDESGELEPEEILELEDILD